MGAMSPFIIREPSPADREQWDGLFNGYNRFYGRHGSTALPDAVVDATWARIFDPKEPVHALVAEQDGRLVALTHYLYHRSTTAIEMSCYLQDLFTAPESRGQGIARALIE
jgi:GNAT superfamily N-acetyltransferase